MKRISEQIKKIDQFGQGLGFTINGDQTYHTTVGGLVSLGYGLLTLAYLTLQFYVMVTYGNTTF
jgi:hypothetical protein